MAISEQLQARLRAHTEAMTDDELSALEARTPEDWNRFGMEAMAAQIHGDARAFSSRGVLRFHGAGVEGHRVSLSSTSLIADAWQRSVTAVGAALEGVKSARGQVPASITARTALMLESAPAPGSVIFNITPKSDALEEVEPGGDRPLAAELSERPLIDRASEVVVSLLGEMAQANLDATERIADRLGDLGVRVGSSLSHLAGAITRAGVALDTAWEEPERDTLRSRVTPEQARWISRFIDNRSLHRDEYELVGTLRTISFDDKWKIVLDDGQEMILDASDVPESIAREHNLDNRVSMTVEIARHVRPDGRETNTYKLLRIGSAES